MPWKLCPYCGGQSYSAATTYTRWPCPYCSKDLRLVPEVDPQIIEDQLAIAERHV